MSDNEEINWPQLRLQQAIELTHSASGYEREMGILRLLNLPNGNQALAHIIERLNDWVEPIRQLAEQVIKQWLITENLWLLIQCLPQLMHLQKCSRANHDHIIGAYQQFIAKPEHQNDIVTLLPTFDENITRYLLPLIEQAQSLSQQELILCYLQHSCILLQYRGLDLLKAASFTNIKEVLSYGLRSKFMPVRRECFMTLRRMDPQQAFVVAKEYLFDRHYALREIAIQYLIEHQVDVESTYSQVFHEPLRVLRLKAALSGLAFLGAKNWQEKISEYLLVELPSIRKAALLAIAHLIPSEELFILLMPMLRDSSLAVAKESVRLMRRNRQYPSLDDLVSLLEDKSVALEVIHILVKYLAKWDRLIILLYLQQQGVAGINRDLIQWNACFNQSYSQPNLEHHRYLLKLWPHVKPSLNAEFVRQIEFSLRPYGIHLERL